MRRPNKPLSRGAGGGGQQQRICRISFARVERAAKAAKPLARRQWGVRGLGSEPAALGLRRLKIDAELRDSVEVPKDAGRRKREAICDPRRPE